MTPDSAFNFPTERELLIALMLDEMSDYPDNPLAQAIKDGELPKEFDEVIDGLLLFIKSAQQSESLVSGLAPEENMEALGKVDNGLQTFDNLYEARAKSFGALARMFLGMIDGINDLALAKRVSESQSMLELIRIYNPEFEEASLAPVKKFNQVLFRNFSNTQLDMAFTYLKSALACQIAGLTDQAKLFTDILVENMVGHAAESTKATRDHVLKAQGVKELVVKAGKAGASKRHEPAEKTKAAAIELFRAGKFKNMSQAADTLYPQVKSIGIQNGFHFTSDINGPRTLYNWLRQSQKIHSSR